MKRFLAALMAVILTLTTFSACANGEHFTFGDAITRGEWIEYLGARLGMDEYQVETPAFSDVSNTSSLFPYVQSMSEWDILRDVKEKLEPDKLATPKFVVSTGLYAADFDFTEAEGATDEEKVWNYAIANGLVTDKMKKNKRVSPDEAEAILDAIVNYYLYTISEPRYETVYGDAVVELPEEASVRPVSEDAYSVSGAVPKVGDIYIMPATEKHPYGYAVKVTKVQQNADGTYTVDTVEPEMEEVLVEQTYTGVVAPGPDDITLMPGVELISVTSDDTACEESDLVNVSGGNLRDSGAKDKRIGGEDLKFNWNLKVNLKDGKVGVTSNPGFDLDLFGKLTGSKSDPLTEKEIYKVEGDKKSIIETDYDSYWKSAKSVKELEESYKKENTKEVRKALDKAYKDRAAAKKKIKDDLTKKLDDTRTDLKKTLMENRFSAGWEVTGTLSVKDLYAYVDYELGFFKNPYYNITIHHNTELNIKVEGTLTYDLPIATWLVPLGPTGATLEIVISLKAELNGTVSLGIGFNQTIKIKHEKGNTSKTCDNQHTFKFEVQAELEAGPKVKILLRFLGFGIIDIGFSVTAKVNIGYSYEKLFDIEEVNGEERLVITRNYGMTGSFEMPFVNLELGTDSQTLVHKLKLTFKYTFPDTFLKRIKKDFFGEDGKPKHTTVTIMPLDSDDELDLGEDESLEDSYVGGTGDEEYYIDPNYVDISDFLLIMEPGEQSKLNYFVTPDLKGEATWETSDNRVATVDFNGTITAKKAGTCTITIKVTNPATKNKYKAFCVISVVDSGEEISDLKIPQ